MLAETSPMPVSPVFKQEGLGHPFSSGFLHRPPSFLQPPGHGDVLCVHPSNDSQTTLLAWASARQNRHQ